MPETRTKPVRRRAPARKARVVVVPSRALMIIDHERLQAAAWAEFHTARKRMERTTRELHRHEEVDVPEYQQWLHQTFPELVTRLRELHDRVLSTARKIQAVQERAFYYGGSPKRIWREQKKREAEREDRAQQKVPPEPEPEESGNGRRYEAHPDDFEFASGPAPSLEARAIYRRLVQRLHPDRGGDWTAVRQRLWHEVQHAWAAGDADWLARLEVDWESAHDVLGPKSPLSRLRRAIAELDAARRDTERKLHEYRAEPAWRFTKTEKKRSFLHQRIEREFVDQIRSLQRQLEHMNRTIAAWEDDWTRGDTRVKRGWRVPRS